MQRRSFLKWLGLGVGAASTAGIAQISRAQEIASTHGSHNAPVNAPVSQQPEIDWVEMNHHHKMGIDTYLENIGNDPYFWDNDLEFTVAEDGAKVFDLYCQEIRWDTGGGMDFHALSFNGRVPGPTIRVDEGDLVRVNVINEMTQPTAVHWHGLILPVAMDGVPFITQDPIMPGETFTYEFIANPIGSHMYHSHYNSVEQVTKGMLGGFIVTPKDKSREPEVDADYVMILNDSALGFTINGRGFPYTQPIVAKLGDKIRVRYFNEGLMIHPMHLHGIPQLVFAKDGHYLPAPYMADTINIAPGERYDVVIDCTEPGIWAYHCHILNHAEGRDGMFGMVLTLNVVE